jgi:hypothetical protein
MKKSVLLFLLWPVFLLAAGQPARAPADPHLVEVRFPYYLRTAEMPRHVEIILYLGARSRGQISDDPMWARMGGATRDEEAGTKAAECRKLCAALSQPRKLPESPSRIVTVKCADGGGWIVRKFPIDQVPAAVRQILIAMGFSDEEFKSLTFIPNRP